MWLYYSVGRVHNVFRFKVCGEGGCDKICSVGRVNDGVNLQWDVRSCGYIYSVGRVGNVVIFTVCGEVGCGYIHSVRRGVIWLHVKCVKRGAVVTFAVLGEKSCGYIYSM